MAYNENFPADDSYLSDFPAGDREQTRALKDDQIVNAGKLQGLTIGNENGQIPINNGTENTNLNAALLNGKSSGDFATSNHTHDTATQSSNGYMSNADKKKLDGIASGAEVNQNAFANVKVGSNTIQADAKQDTLELAAGANISLVGDANNDKVTIAVTGKVASASKADSATEASNINAGFENNNVNFPATDFRVSVLNRSGRGYSVRPFFGKLPNNTYTSSAGIGFGAGDTHGFLQCPSQDAIAYVGGGNANKINWYKQLAFADGTGASGTWGINISGTAAKATKSTSADSATKATQDSAGQTINTTYVKGVTANNATLTITKGNGSTSTTTVNNVSRAEYSDRVGTNAGYTGSTTGSSLKGGLSQAAIYNNSFPFSYGNLISVKNGGANQIALEWSGTTGAIGRVAVRSARDAALGTWSAWRYLAYTESPAFSGSPTAPTPGTSDNGTRIATTAFVRNLINQFKTDGTLGGIVGGSLTQNGWVKFSNGLILQWGSGDGYDGANPSWYSFPIAFPSACYQVVTNGKGNGYGAKDGNSCGACNWNTKQVQLYSNDGTKPVNYIAIGK